MNDKVKKILIPFILMIIIDLGSFYLSYGENFGEGLSPHLGVLLISGLIFGPYGAVGSVIGNVACDFIRGYRPILIIPSALISFGVSYLAYKLWYGTFKSRLNITNPKLNNTNNILLFLSIITICSFIYSLFHGKIIYLTYPETAPITSIIEIRFFLNFINASFIMGIVGIWISNRLNIFHIPKISKNKSNNRLYRIIGDLLILTLILTLIIDQFTKLNANIAIAELTVASILLIIYLKKPITSKITISKSKSVPENVMNIFLLTTLLVVIFGVLLSYDHILLDSIEQILPLTKNEIMITIMALIDALLLIFLIPSIIVLRYIEMKIIEPILSFSKTNDFIRENEKIESDELIEAYSKYINEETEIGTLARSFTDLITFNNYYIKNIQEIEGEKERIKAELDIATRIQAANLPTDSIETDDYIINGYSKPAKEVGGDFFDYYELDDDNLAIVIGDASGKGVPAAILAMNTQVIIKQLLKHDHNPSKILYSLNNQLCETNTVSMFITLWLGIYNKTTKTLTFSNAGHDPPLVKENDKFELLTIDSGIVLGAIENFDYITEEITLPQEIVLYTDGITDANNAEYEMYGEKRLLDFFNEFKSDEDPIKPLLADINKFTQDSDQFDDITLVYLKIEPLRLIEAGEVQSKKPRFLK